MKGKIALCLTLVLSFVLAGCVTHREFSGTVANLKKNGAATSPASGIKWKVACSDSTTNGGNYTVLSLPSQNCQLILFYPTMSPDQSLFMEIGTNQTHTWRFGETDIELPSHQMPVGAWLTREPRLDFARLGNGTLAACLPANAERMHGVVQIVWESHAELQVELDLSDDSGQTKLCGSFESSKELWSPLVPLAIVSFLVSGHPSMAAASPPPQAKQAEIGGAKPPANINITVQGNVNHPGSFSVPEFTTIDRAIEIAGGQSHQTHTVRVKRMERGKEEFWNLDSSDQLGSFFFMLIQGDEVEL